MNPLGLFRSDYSGYSESHRCHVNFNGLFKRKMLMLSHLQAKFEFHHGDYEKQCLHALGRKDKAGMVLNNPTQSVFLFMDRQHLQVSDASENKKLPTGGHCPHEERRL